VAKWLYGLDGKIDIHDDNVFRNSCYYGHLELAKWLCGLDDAKEKINIHVDNEYVFRTSCYHGHLDMAKWLYSLDRKIDIHAYDEYVFYWTCWNGHLEVIEYLILLDDNNTSEINEAMMKGIMSFFNNNGEFSHDKYVKIKKMLSLVKEFDEYQRNINNIKFLLLLCYEFNYNFINDVFEYIKN